MHSFVLVCTKLMHDRIKIPFLLFHHATFRHFSTLPCDLILCYLVTVPCNLLARYLATLHIARYLVPYSTLPCDLTYSTLPCDLIARYLATLHIARYLATL